METEFIKKCIGKIDNRGTAFFISKNVLVTARHVIKDMDPNSIEVEFPYLTDTKNKFTTKVLNQGDEKVDVALLKLVNEDDCSSHYLDLTNQEVKPDEDWITYGYPTSYKTEGDKLEGLVDDNNVKSDYNDKFYNIKLKCEYFKSISPKSYISGLSGAPLIINGKVKGIIKIELDRKLGAVSVNHFYDILKRIPDIKFNNNSYNIDKPIYKKLLNGSKAYFDRLMQTKHRFLNIKKIILTDVKSELISTGVKCNGEQNSLTNCIEKLWEDPNWHSLILGSGGMGKTVSLINLWDTLLIDTEKHIIPLYLSLDEYNNLTKIEEKNNFIINSIGRYYLGKQILESKDINDIWHILGHPNNNGKNYPSIILFLDGLNEITKEKSGLLIELTKLINEASGLQVVLTSRYDFRENFLWKDFKLVELVDLSDEQIAKYLGKDISNIEGKLITVLRNPMMLTLYSASNENMQKYLDNKNFDFKQNIKSRGELFWNFIESYIVKLVCSPTNLGGDGTCRKFLIKHILPYIGYKMEESGKYTISTNEFIQLIDDAYTEISLLINTGTFKEYWKYKEILFLTCKSEDDKTNRYEWVIKTICTEINLIVENSDSDNHSFIHQNFRDFFATKYIIDQCKSELVNGKLTQIFKTRALPTYLREFIGEIEGEHNTVPKLSKEEWYIESNKTMLIQMIDLCKNIFDGSLGYTVWNIIEIWKDVRKELTGIDLSYLDLQDINLNNVRCSRWLNDKYYLETNFSGSLLKEENILPQGHKKPIKSAVYNSNSALIASLSYDGIVKEWSTTTGKCNNTYKLPISIIKKANEVSFAMDNIVVLDSELNILREFTCTDQNKNCNNSSTYPQGKTIKNTKYLSEFGKNKKNRLEYFKLIETDVESGKNTTEYIGHTESIKGYMYNKKGDKLLTYSSYTIKEWDTSNGKNIATYKIDGKNVIFASYNEYGTKILSVFSDNIIREWDVETSKCIQKYEGHIDYVSQVTYSHDESKILSVSNDTMKEWSVNSGECIRTYKGYACEITCASYNNKGNRILVASNKSQIYEFDLITGKCLRVYGESLSDFRNEVYDEDVNCVCYNDWQNKVLFFSQYSVINEWDSRNGLLLNRYFDYDTNEYISENGKYLLCTAYDDLVVCNTSSLKPIYVYNDCLSNFKKVYNKNQTKFIKVSSNEVMEVNARSGDYKVFSGHRSYVASVVYNPDETKILSTSLDDSVREWDIQSGEQITAFIIIPGLIIQNCQFYKLNKNSKLSNTCKSILQMYGAKL